MALIELKHDTDVFAVPEIEMPAVGERPRCPACDAAPADQAVVAQQPDGALELVVLMCRRCGHDHPIWY